MSLFGKLFGENAKEKQTADFYTAVEARRSVYAISKEPVVSDERIRAVIEHAVLHSPSSFNSQSGRVVVLLGKQSDRLWEITTEALRQVVPADQFQPTADKMQAFGSGYGTVLFFEDMKVVEGLQQQFPAYSDNFPIWANQSNGMLQYVVWTSLELEGFGATLQHYNPLIDQAVQAEWSIPDSWKLIAQMPFGKPAAPAGEKTFQPLEDRVKFY